LTKEGKLLSVHSVDQTVSENITSHAGVNQKIGGQTKGRVIICEGRLIFFVHTVRNACEKARIFWHSEPKCSLHILALSDTIWSEKVYQ
jgi:hypothetical protein